MQEPLINRARRGLQHSRTKSLPPPVGGWNVRDALAGMPATDAVVMENWFPRAHEVEIRPGVALWGEGFGSEVAYGLMPWNGPTANQLFATTDAGVYNTTATGLVGAPVAVITNGYMQSVNFGTAGGQFLVAVNGTDKLLLYNGTTWTFIDGTSVPAITGITTTNIINVAVLKQRLWFVLRNSSSAWYLPVSAVGGAAVEFPLATIFSRGGTLTAIGSWTIDGGDGSDDYGVFVSSEGEVAVYKGTDPSSSSTWTHVGTYYVGEPLGTRCLHKFGGDLLFLCQNGLFPLSKAVQSVTVNRRSALTNKIDTAFTDAVELYSQNRGWEIHVFPDGGLLLVNVPVSATVTEQFVMNTVTGSWCKFTGIFATSWRVFNDLLYVGTAARIGRAWSGVSDFGVPIAAVAQQAYNYFDARGQLKLAEMVRLTLNISGAIDLTLGFDTDFEQNAIASQISLANVSGSSWGSGAWDTAIWGVDTEVKREWATVPAPPFYAGALRVQATTGTVRVRWSSTDFVFSLGGVL